MTKFSDWPTGFSMWLSYRTALAAVTLYLWWPKSDAGWRKFGFVVAYLLAWLFVMRYVFDMK
jgi:hypothetical protein